MSSQKKREPLTVHLPLDVIERLKDALHWTPDLTLEGLAEEALCNAVDELEKKHGTSFPPRVAISRLQRFILLARLSEQELAEIARACEETAE